MNKLTPPIRAVIIDLDGTMIDTGADFHAAINAMRRELGLSVDVSLRQITDLVGKGSENLVRSVLALDLDASEVAQHVDFALAAYQRHYELVNGQFSNVYAGVREGLQAMHENGLLMACVTNKPYSFAKTLLEHFELDAFFSLLYGGDSFERKKPDPLPLLEACRHFGLAPKEVLVLGDSSNDAQAARAAGCPVWIVPYGFNHGESVQKIDSDGIVSTLFAAAKALTL